MINKIISSSFYNIYSSLIKFIIFILLAKLLSQNDFGIYNFYISLFSLSSLLIIFGFHRTIFKFNHVTTLGLFFKMSLVIFIVYILVFYVVQAEDYVDMISLINDHNYMILYVFIISVFTVFYAYFRAISLLNIENISTKFIYPTLLFSILGIIYFLDYNVRYYQVFLFEILLMTSLISLTFLLHKNKFIGLFEKPINSSSETVKYSFKIFITNVFTRATFLFDILFIGLLMTPKDVAEYAVALKLTLGITIIVAAFIQVLEKHMATSKDITKNLKDIIGLLFLISTVISLIILLFFNEIIELFGENYSNVKYILILLLFSKILDGIFSLYGIIMFYSQRENIMIKISFFSFIISMILNYFMINFFGLIGAAWASLISIFIFGLFTYIKFNERTGFNFFTDNRLFFYSIVFGLSILILIFFLDIDSYGFGIKLLLLCIVLMLTYIIGQKSIKTIRSVNE